jgi:hypothetical protein
VDAGGVRQPYLVPCGTERKEENAIHHTLQVCQKAHAHVGETLLKQSRDQSEEKEQRAMPHKSTLLRSHLDLLLSFVIDSEACPT